MKISNTVVGVKYDWIDISRWMNITCSFIVITNYMTICCKLMSAIIFISFRTAVNWFNSVFITVQSEVKFSLLQTYCTARYGCQAWDLDTTFADKMNVEWRKAVRRTAGLPRQTRSVLLPGLAGNEKMHPQHERRIYNLFTQCYLAAILRSDSLPRKHSTIKLVHWAEITHFYPPSAGIVASFEIC